MKAAEFMKRFGKLELILFWLAIEYITTIRIGKILSGTDWVRWAQLTGYSGVSLWILMIVLLGYYTVVQKRLQWLYAAVLVIVILAPILYSYSLPPVQVTNVEDEWVARTAAWISVLILLSAIIKESIRKK